MYRYYLSYFVPLEYNRHTFGHAIIERGNKIEDKIDLEEIKEKIINGLNDETVIDIIIINYKLMKEL